MGKKTKKKLTLKLVQVEKRAAKFNLRMVSGVTQEVTLTSRIEIFQGWCWMKQHLWIRGCGQKL